jgi:hypothetical protein
MLISNPLSEFPSRRGCCGTFARSGQKFRDPTNGAPMEAAKARIEMPIGIDHQLHDVLLRQWG